DNPTQIIDKYLEWADEYKENKITIFYDSMSNNTRMMADGIAQGITEADPNVAVKIFNVSRHDKNEILANVFCSKGILVGSSTMNNVMMPKIAGMLEEITGLRFKGKKAGAFGSYGWNGGAVDRIHARLTDAGFFTTVGMKTKWRPDGKALEECREHGRKIAREWALQPIAAAEANTAQPDESAKAEVSIAQPATVKSNNSAPAENAPAVDNTEKQICTVCQWVYDPELGEPNQDVAPGTAWNDVPDYFLCPDCGIGKEVFEPIA
ncbi:rubredoxin, partial [Photobacterium sp. OFAV2-7]